MEKACAKEVAASIHESPRRGQAVEKVVVGPVSGPKQDQNKPETLKNGVLGAHTRLKKGHEGVFQHAGAFPETELPVFKGFSETGSPPAEKPPNQHANDRDSREHHDLALVHEGRTVYESHQLRSFVRSYYVLQGFDVRVHPIDYGPKMYL